MKIGRLFWTHPAGTEHWHCQEHFGTNIEVYTERLNFSRVNRKRSQGLMSGELDGGGGGGGWSCTTLSVSRKS